MILPVSFIKCVFVCFFFWGGCGLATGSATPSRVSVMLRPCPISCMSLLQITKSRVAKARVKTTWPACTWTYDKNSYQEEDQFVQLCMWDVIFWDLLKGILDWKDHWLQQHKIYFPRKRRDVTRLNSPNWKGKPCKCQTPPFIFRGALVWQPMAMAQN